MLKNCVTADSYFHKYVEMIMDKINNLKQDDIPSNGFEALYLGFWEFDVKNSNVLDKYKTVEELLKNNTDYDEVLNIAESKETEETKALVMPKP